MRARIGLLPVAIAATILLAFTWVPTRSSAQEASPEQQLAEKYAPILMLREQARSCDKAGEGYFPTTVDFLWNNPDIVLKARGEGSADADPIITRAPTPQDLIAAGPASYLDFPGNPRDPGCSYEQYFKRTAAEFGLTPTAYVHVAYDPNDRRLYVQYWFYYFFNDWNNTHESDWEGIALAFNAEDATQALTQDPVMVFFNQHAGGETARWTDSKLRKDGTHLVAYASAGSHATYYGPDTMIGWGENGTAFGCDDTTSPSIATPLDVVVVPDLVDTLGPFAWAVWEGRWGERQTSPFGGPSGPNQTRAWNEPSGKYETFRGDVLKVPKSTLIGINTSDAFCTLSKRGSQAAIYIGSHPWATASVVLGLLAIVAFLLARVWPMFMEALDIFGNELRTFLGIGIVAVPIGIAFNGLVALAFQIPGLEWALSFFDGSDGGRFSAVLLGLLLQQGVMAAVVAPAVIYATNDIRQGVKPGVFASYRGAIRVLPVLAAALLAVLIVVTLFTSTGFLIPLAIYVLVRWQFFSQAIILNGAEDPAAALRQSWRVTEGHWWRTLDRTLAFQLLGIIPGPLFGVLLLIVGGSDVQFANTVSSFVYAAFIPISVIGLSMTYRRASGEQVIEPFVMTRERDPERAARHSAAEDAALGAARRGTGD